MFLSTKNGWQTSILLFLLGIVFVPINLTVSYYYYEGIYYEKSGAEYVVVDAPQDVLVAHLPEDADEITVDGKRYFVYDNIVYSIVTTPDGKRFKVVGDLN